MNAEDATLDFLRMLWRLKAHLRQGPSFDDKWNAVRQAMEGHPTLQAWLPASNRQLLHRFQLLRARVCLKYCVYKSPADTMGRLLPLPDTASEIEQIVYRMLHFNPSLRKVHHAMKSIRRHRKKRNLEWSTVPLGEVKNESSHSIKKLPPVQEIAERKPTTESIRAIHPKEDGSNPKNGECDATSSMDAIAIESLSGHIGAADIVWKYLVALESALDVHLLELLCEVRCLNSEEKELDKLLGEDLA